MATIDKRTAQDGTISYRVRVRVKGRPTVTETFPNVREARKWAAQTEAAIREGRYFGGVQRKTVSDAITKYIEDVLPGLKNPQDSKNRTSHLEWWRGEIGAYFLADVTPVLLGEMRDKIAKTPKADGKPRSPSTVVRYIASLSHCLTTCVEWGWLQHNPMRGVKKPKEAKGRVRFLSDDEREALLEAAKEHRNAILYPIVLLALCSGARQGELLALRWGDIDWTRNQFTIQDSKNGERRTIPLVGPARAVLDEMKKVRSIKDDRVFGRSTFPHEHWHEVLDKAGIEDFHFHDCRHSCASYLAMNGASLLEIAAVLGHKTLAMVKRYAHLSEAHTHGVLAKMTDSVFGS